MKRIFWLAVAKGLGGLLISGAAIVAAYHSSKSTTNRRW